MNNTESIIAKLHSETAKIAWHDLQRFFAKGVVMVVEPSEDLVEVASFFAQDDAKKLKVLLDQASVAAATDEQARTWYKNNAELWSVVVAPFVLVQDKVLAQDKS